MLLRIKDVYASLFGARAISYRRNKGFHCKDAKMAVAIQSMVKSDASVSGVMFSIHPETGFDRAIFINASYGLGEGVVKGLINPDEYLIHKPKIPKEEVVILYRKLGSKDKKLIFKENLIAEIKVDEQAKNTFCLNETDLSNLSRYSRTIEDHYGCPMDIEWAKDGTTGEIYILQARPETSIPKETNMIESYGIRGPKIVLTKGSAVGRRIARGRARVLTGLSEASNFLPGEVLVTEMTDPNWEPVMEKASAIVTDRGGRTCHAAIIARELGLAAVVGCHDATQKIPDQMDVTVSCAEGDTGKIYKGLLEIEKYFHEVKHATVAVDLMLIAANPTKSFSCHRLPHKGIGLARLEFIIANSIGIHPNALIHPQKLPDDIRALVEKKTCGFISPTDFYVDTLAQGISCLSAIADPYPAIVRLSDFKSNEYRDLLGGRIFEPEENNPMLGFRGASRYLSKEFYDAFALECKAISKARSAFSNISVMVPFVRTLKEAKEVIELLDSHGLKSGKDGLKVIMMCEVPSNAILAEEFLEYFDGFSIGSNDLTQLTLGLDRDSQMVAKSFSEQDKGVLSMIDLAITACKKHNKYVGICGQGPSDDLIFAKWLVDKGIDSISVNPDSLLELYRALST